MNKIRLLIVILILMCFRTAYAANSSLIPSELKYEGYHYYYDPRWKDKERIVKADLDYDGQNEIVISFAAGFKPDEWKEGDDLLDMPFYQICKKTGEGYKAVKTIMGNQYLGEMSIEDFSKDRRQQLVLWSSGGAHHTDLYIYEWLNGDYKRIFEDGSACSIQADFKATPPMIKIGKEKWNTEGWSYVDEPDWEIWLWDGKRFYKEEI